MEFRITKIRNMRDALPNIVLERGVSVEAGFDGWRLSSRSAKPRGGFQANAASSGGTVSC